MTEDEAVTEILDRLRGAAHLYNISPDALAEIENRLGGRHLLERAGYTTAGLSGTLAHIAYAHRIDCQGGDCETCRHLQRGLTIAYAAARVSWRQDRPGGHEPGA